MVLTNLHMYIDPKLEHSSEDDQQFICRSSEAKRWSASLSLERKIYILEVDT